VSLAERILVIEDNLANQMLTCAVLERGGFAVDVASTPGEALRTLKQRVPALILMDMYLPGEDGLSLTRRIKADPDTAAIPIIAVTAHAMVGDRETTLDAGCDYYITKPIDTRTFADVVRLFLRSSPSNPASPPGR
jgi:two-component system, cell cycle response regulator DivK